MHPKSTARGSEIRPSLPKRSGNVAGGRGAAPARLIEVPGMDRQLHIQDRVAQALRKVRQVHGALSLETIEARPVFDGGALIDLRPEAKNRAHELIEDFMVAANGVTARYLASKGAPSLRRVLRTPKNWTESSPWLHKRRGTSAAAIRPGAQCFPHQASTS